MKIRLRHVFQYQIDARTTGTLPAGVHDVDKELAQKAIRFGGAKLVNEKKAPENKVVKASETKVVKKRRRRTGSKSKS